MQGPRRRGTPRELVDSDLVHKIDARPYHLHDYGKHQSDAVDLSQKRAKVGRRGAHVTNHEKRAIYVDKCEHCHQAAVDGESGSKTRSWVPVLLNAAQASSNRRLTVNVIRVGRYEAHGVEVNTDGGGLR